MIMFRFFCRMWKMFSKFVMNSCEMSKSYFSMTNQIYPELILNAYNRKLKLVFPNILLLSTIYDNECTLELPVSNIIIGKWLMTLVFQENHNTYLCKYNLDRIYKRGTDAHFSQIWEQFKLWFIRNARYISYIVNKRAKTDTKTLLILL